METETKEYIERQFIEWASTQGDSQQEAEIAMYGHSALKDFTLHCMQDLMCPNCNMSLDEVKMVLDSAMQNKIKEQQKALTEVKDFLGRIQFLISIDAFKEISDKVDACLE